MGIPAQPALTRPSRSAGIALPAVLFGIVMVSLLSSGIWLMTEQNTRISVNREEAARALMLAEAGAAHALALLKADLQSVSFNDLLIGDDATPNTADDGILAGFGLPTAHEIPSGGVSYGGGRYMVQIVDDSGATEDLDPLNDVNGNIIARCTGVSRTGAKVTIDATLGMAESLPAIVVNGNIEISGNPNIGTGSCGTIHANGDLLISGEPVIDGSATASGTAEGEDANGDPAQGGQPQVPIPDYDYTDFCDASADYILQSNGWILRVSDMTLHNATSDQKFGWKRASSSPVVWDQEEDIGSGTYCAQGNVTIGGNPNVVSLSIAAQGSIEISGNPILGGPDHPDGLLFYAGGDLKLNGNPATDFAGVMFGESQCEVSGNPYLSGNLICFDSPDPAGAIDLTSEIKINGNPTVVYTCGVMAGGGRRYISWHQEIGT